MPTLVQSTSRVAGGYPSANQSFASTPAVGNLLIVYAILGPNFGGTITDITVTDNQGNTWSTAVFEGDNGAVAVAYCVPTTSSGTYTVTVQPTVPVGSNDSGVAFAMQEWSGMAASPADQSGSARQISGSTFSVTAGGSNAAADSVVACVFFSRGDTISSIGNNPPATGYTNIFSVLSAPFGEPAGIASYKVVSAAETSSASWGVVENSSDGFMVIATFSAAGGAVEHASSGSAQGAGATVDGSASRTRQHAATGAIEGGGAQASGAATRTHVHSATGEVVGGGAVASGAALKYRVHESSGAILAGGAVVNGAAQIVIPEHDAAGAASGGGAEVSGSAGRNAAHTSSGSIVGAGAAVTGSAQRTAAPVTHEASGVLLGGGAQVAAAGQLQSQFVRAPAGGGYGRPVLNTRRPATGNSSRPATTNTRRP